MPFQMILAGNVKSGLEALLNYNLLFYNIKDFYLIFLNS